MHASMVYYQQKPLPYLNKDAFNELVWDNTAKQWSLLADNITVAWYAAGDVRMSLVYRARCFTNASEAKRYTDETIQGTKILSLDVILKTFAVDLAARGYGTAEENLSMDRLALAFKLLKIYGRYPLPIPTVWIPYNYCAAMKIFPALRHILHYFC